MLMLQLEAGRPADPLTGRLFGHLVLHEEEVAWMFGKVPTYRMALS